MIQTKSERIFHFANTIFLLASALMCLTPMLHVLAASFSSSEAISRGMVTLWPVNFTTAGYSILLRNPLFWNSVKNGVVRTLLGTAINLLCTCLTAYPLSLSSRSFPMRTAYAWFFFIPSLVGGGLIPTYMVVQETGVRGSIWALVLPGAVPAFYVLVLLNFFRSLPAELSEAAKIDGAGHLRVLWRIYLPLSMPPLATLSMYALLTHWNDWLSGALYLDKLTDFPLMTYMQTVTVGSDLSKLVVSTLPVIMIYPVCQRYFIKGLVMGGVKG